MTSALDDITVASFAQVGQGPLAAQMLGDMGAEVIKIEPPGGEWERDWSLANAYLDGESACYLAMNRNKKSIELNLKDEDQKQVAYDIIEDADILVENFRPGVMEGLGFGYEELSELNPQLVYCSWSGYGEEGPLVEEPGQDLLIQSVSGLASLNGKKDDPPIPTSAFIIDFLSSTWLAFAAVTAIHHRNRTGEGQKVEGDLLSTALHLLCEEIVVHENTEERPERSEAGIAHPYSQAPYGIYETKDGYLTLSLSLPSDVGEALDIDRIKNIDTWEEAYERRDEIKEQIERVVQSQTTEYWLETLSEHDIWASPVNTLTEAIEHPQVDANDMLRTIEHPTIGELTLTGMPVRFEKTPGSIRLHPPLAGEQTEEILQDHGYDPDYLDN